MRVQKVFNGYLRITNEKFLDAYENSNSTEFANLANKVKEAVSPAAGQGALSLLSALALPPSPGAERTRLPFPPHLWAGRWHGLPGSWGGGALVPGGRERRGPGPGLVAALRPAVSLPSFPQLKLLYRGVPSLGPYHKESAVTAFRWVLGRRLGGSVPCGGGAESSDCGTMKPRGLAWGAGRRAPFFPQRSLRSAVSQAGVTTGALPG